MSDTRNNGPRRMRRDEHDTTWHEEAACRTVDPEIFYTPEVLGARSRAHDWTEARLVCASCPVRSTCLEVALERREPFGMWGGKDEQERARMLRSVAA